MSLRIIHWENQREERIIYKLDTDDEFMLTFSFLWLSLLLIEVYITISFSKDFLDLLLIGISRYKYHALLLNKLKLNHFYCNSSPLRIFKNWNRIQIYFFRMKSKRKTKPCIARVKRKPLNAFTFKLIIKFFMKRETNCWLNNFLDFVEKF